MKKYLALFLAAVTVLSSCNIGKSVGEEWNDTKLAVEEFDEVEALAKVCKVWGYTKYAHPVFLKGERDWDQELLTLLPQVQEAQSQDEVNELLHRWFVSLGEVEQNSRKTTVVNADVQADLSWTNNTKYIGEALAVDMELLSTAKPVSNRSKAPVMISVSSIPLDYSNEPVYENFDYTDVNNRLLGLFRLWNAMEYYFPYQSVLDEDWHDVLEEMIPYMVEAEDSTTYHAVIAMTAAKLQDAHVNYDGIDQFLIPYWGKYQAPVYVQMVGKQAVVKTLYEDDCGLLSGDVILTVEGIPVEDIISEKMKYFATTQEDKLENRIALWIIQSKEQNMRFSILRDGIEQTVVVSGVTIPERYELIRQNQAERNASEILEGNIGLLNPKFTAQEAKRDSPQAVSDFGFYSVMEKLKDTDGLIVDLRQYPSEPLAYYLPHYFGSEKESFVEMTRPVAGLPGTYQKEKINAGSVGHFPELYDYAKPVVVLIDETSQSQAEFTAMALSNGANVTIMGESTIGSDGNISYFIFPDGEQMMHTALGVYTPGGGQTQRIGISPDVPVEYTVEGIKEGRDEYVEAALAYIKEQNNQ